MATHTLTRATLLVCILHFISATYIVDTSRLDVSTGSGAWETRREGPVLAEGESSSSTGGDHEFSAHFSRSIQQEQDSEDTPLPQHLFKGRYTAEAHVRGAQQCGKQTTQTVQIIVHNITGK